MTDDKKLLDGNQNFEKDVKNHESVQNQEIAADLRMGIGSWRPEWLQRFNSIKCFVVVFSFASIVQGCLTMGVTLSSIQTIEKEFGFSSKVTGAIVAGNDAAALLFVTIVSFFGAKGHKPKWIGIGTIISGIGAGLFAFPKVLVGTYKPDNYKEALPFDICNTNRSFVELPSTCESGVSGSSIFHACIFFFAQFIMGAGTTPLQTLGPTFLDENVSPRASPMYLGIWFASTMMGPGLGFLLGGAFLKIFTDINLPDGLKDLKLHDSRWIGAWWLPFVGSIGLYFICGLLLLLFPKKFPSTALKREASIKSGQLPSSDDNVKYTFKGYLKQLVRICFNKVFLLSSLAIASKTYYASAISTFITKLLVLKFGVLPQDAGIYLGSVLLPSMIVGIFGGSFIVRKINTAIAAKTAAKICVIITVLTAANSLIFLLPGCNNTNMAGVKVPYQNSTMINGLSSKCNLDCNCIEKKYMPICGSDGITYHSPCHAGCTVMAPIGPKELIFGNCSCIPVARKAMSSRNTTGPMSLKMQFGPPASNMTKQADYELMIKMRMIKMQIATFVNKATMGKCDRDCKNFAVFLLFVVVSLIISFLSGTPHKIMVLRCVPDNQRAFALGTQYLIIRSLSFLPAPIILGAILDTQCITWGYDKCGNRRNCYDYNIDKISINIVVLGVCTSVVAAILYTLAWWWYPNTADNSNDKLLKQTEEDKL